MKKVSLVFALVLGFAAASFAQPGAAKCAWGQAESHGQEPVVHFSNIHMFGISDSEGENVYSVSLYADYNKGFATAVVLKENKSGKAWYMSQMSPAGKNIPLTCRKYDNLQSDNVMVYRSIIPADVVVYAIVPKGGDRVVHVYVYKPARSVVFTQ